MATRCDEMEFEMHYWRGRAEEAEAVSATASSSQREDQAPPSRREAPVPPRPPLSAAAEASEPLQPSEAPAPLSARVAAGGVAGAVASALANPTDVVKVRLQADGRLKMAGGTPRYEGTVHAFRAIAAAEGSSAAVVGGARPVAPAAAPAVRS